MIYRYFIALLFSVSVFAVEENCGKETCCIQENLKVDTSDWKQFPIVFGWVDLSSSKDTQEKVTVSLPSEPQFVQRNGLQSPYITVTDLDGMTYSLSFMEIPAEDFSLSQSVNFLAESISKSSTKKLFFFGCPNPNPNDSIYSLMWVEGDKMVQLKLIKSAHCVYFLETTISREIYRDFEVQSQTESFDTMMRDFRKSYAFTSSFIVEQLVER